MIIIYVVAKEMFGKTTSNKKSPDTGTMAQSDPHCDVSTQGMRSLAGKPITQNYNVMPFVFLHSCLFCCRKDFYLILSVLFFTSQIASGKALAHLLEICPDLQQYIGDDPQQLQ